MENQITMFDAQENKGGANRFGVTFKAIDSVLGSGYEQKVSELALHDKVAHRAARKNMQIHSAIIAEKDGEFVGFFNIQFSTSTQVFHFGFYTQNAVTFTGLGQKMPGSFMRIMVWADPGQA